MTTGYMLSPICNGEVAVLGPVRDGWQVSARFLNHAGQLRLVELKVYPEGAGDELREPLGDWGDGIAAALDRLPPPASIGARLLRDIDFTTLYDKAHTATKLANKIADRLELEGPHLAEVAASLRITLAAPPGRQPDVKLAEVALQYAAISARSPHPIKAMAEELGRDRRVIKAYVDAARSKGYLTNPGQGRRRSDLTDTAVAVLRRNGRLQKEKS